MARTIAVINDKGGVGKTTTTANLGTALWLLGKKVLLIDTDQQCNLTQIMGIDSLNGNGGESRTIYEWYCDPRKVAIYERYEGLDFVPSSRMLPDLGEKMVNVKHKENILRDRISLVSDQYDYILIDCIPGGRNYINTSVLVASDEVIVPLEASYFSIQGLPNLLNFIRGIREKYKGGDERLLVLGYLLVKYNDRTKLGKEIYNYLRDSGRLEGRLFEASIRVCQKCNESPGEGKTLFEYAPSSSAAQDYMRLACEISGVKRDKRWTSSKWGKKAMLAFSNYLEK